MTSIEPHPRLHAVTLAVVALLTTTLPAAAGAQNAGVNAGGACQAGMAPVTPLKGKLQRFGVHGEALVGNLEGDSPDRCVSVYLPPSYASSPDRRYLARAMFAEAAAWSPDPQNPPFYFDPPTKDGKVRPEVVAAWAANAPLAMIYQYIANLKKLHALAIDAGAQDVGIAADSRRLDSILTRFGVKHEFEIYDPGTHISRVEERIEQNVLPFSSENLAF